MIGPRQVLASRGGSTLAHSNELDEVDVLSGKVAGSPGGTTCSGEGFGPKEIGGDETGSSGGWTKGKTSHTGDKALTKLAEPMSGAVGAEGGCLPLLVM